MPYFNKLSIILSALLLATCASTNSTNPAQNDIAQWEKAAQSGQAKAQYKLGTAYATQQNFAKAAEWLQKSANQGYAPAQNGLSILYLQGMGVTKDDNQALEWLQKSVIQGYPEAQYNLAMLYKNGRVIAKNETQAAAWLQQAALQGDAQAQYELGVMYELGLGIPKDKTKSLEWLQKSAAQGNGDAKNRMGKQYIDSLNNP